MTTTHPTIERSILSLEYVKADIAADADPTGDQVRFAFTAIGADPDEDDWVAGEWDDTVTTSPWRARVLAGPGGTYDPGDTKGKAWAWVDVVDNPEIIKRRFATMHWT